jgi:hypothetical protein
MVVSVRRVSIGLMAGVLFPSGTYLSATASHTALVPTQFVPLKQSEREAHRSSPSSSEVRMHIYPLAVNFYGVFDGKNGNLEEPVKFLKANQGYTV